MKRRYLRSVRRLHRVPVLQSQRLRPEGDLLEGVRSIRVINRDEAEWTAVLVLALFRVEREEIGLSGGEKVGISRLIDGPD